MSESGIHSVYLSAAVQAIGALIEIYVTDRLGDEIARKVVEVVDLYG